MKTLLINGLKVNYEISKEGILLISFYGSSEMTDSEKKKTIAKIGNYLIAEGFVKLPVDSTESV
jgi:hypothetical protein